MCGVNTKRAITRCLYTPTPCSGGAYTQRRIAALREDFGRGGLFPPVEPTLVEYRVFRLIAVFEF